MARKVLSVELDFKNALKSAEEFSSSLEDSLAKALKQDKGFFSFSKGIHKLEQLSEGFRKKQKKFDEAEGLRQKHLNGELQKHLKSLLEQQKKLDEEIGASAGQSQAYTDELKKQQAELKRQIKLGDHIGGNYESYLKTHNKLAKELQNEREHLGKFCRNLGNAAESAKEIHDYFKDLKDPSKLAEGMEGAAERMGEAFKDGIDVQALSRDLGKGLAKGISTATKAMSGGSGAMMAVGGVLAGTVATLGVLLAAFIAVDKKVKEFNKDIVKTHGALSAMRLGGGDLNKGLQVVKHTVMDLSGNLGVSEQEATQLFDTLDKGGLTLDRLTRGARDAADQQKMLTNSLREMHQIANLMGVGLSEYADNLTNYVNDLGMSVNTVNDSFAAIADMASKSSFGTRRFYSMVVQATSGQASLNTRLEDTGDLLLRMSKIMGAKKAAEAVGGEASRLAEQSAQERAKTILVAGGRGRQVYQREAQIQSGNFLRDIARSDTLKNAFQDALRGAGAIRSDQAAPASAEELQRVLSKLTAEQQRGMLARVRASGQDELARRLEQITQLNLGATGGLSAGVGGIGALGAGGSFAMQAAMMERFMDPTTGRLSVENRAAAESVTGLSGTRMDAMLSAMAAQRGDLELMQKLISQGNTAELKKVMDRYPGLKLNAAGKIVDSLGNEIRNSNDLFQATSERTTADLAKLKDEATSIAYQTMDATTSVADILENKVAVYIQRVYEWLNGFLGPMLENLPGIREQKEAFEKKRSTVTAFESAIENLQKQSEGDRTRMARLSTTATTATATPEEKRRAEDEIKRIQESQSHRALQVQGLREAVQRIREGNTYDTRVLVPAHLRGQAGGVEGQLTPEAALARTLRRIDGTTAPATPTPAAPATPTPAASGASPATLTPEERQRRLDAVRRARGIAPATPAPATPAPATTAPAAVPSNRQAEAAAAPTTEAIQGQQDQQADQFQRTLRDNRRRDQRTQRDMERLIKGRDLGDGLASSSLPMAIAVANLKTRVLEGIYKSGGRNADVVQALLSGEATQAQLAMAGEGRASATALNFIREAGLNDFIYRSSGGRGVVTPINREDQVVGMKDGGAIANATGRGTGGNVNISINGGDERRVFEVVRRAIQQAGITPNRVPSGAT